MTPNAIREALLALADEIAAEAGNISPTKRTHPARVMIKWSKRLRRLSANPSDPDGMNQKRAEEDAALGEREVRFVPEQTSASFVVEIPVDDFLSIESHDNRRQSKTLCEQLSELPGVSDVDYNGHFGSNIFYTLDSEHADHKPVLSVIEKYISLSTTGEPKPPAAHEETGK